MNKQTYTVKMDMYTWYDRILEDCEIEVTGACITNPPYPLENESDIEIIEAKIKDSSVLAYMKSIAMNIAEVENRIFEFLKDDPWEFIDYVAEQEDWPDTPSSPN